MDINNYFQTRNDIVYSNKLRQLGLKNVFRMWIKSHWMHLIVGALAILGGLSSFILTITTS